MEAPHQVYDYKPYLLDLRGSTRYQQVHFSLLLAFSARESLLCAAKQGYGLWLPHWRHGLGELQRVVEVSYDGQAPVKKDFPNRMFLHSHILGDSTISEIERALLEVALDWQWDSFLSLQVPADMMEELRCVVRFGSLPPTPHAVYCALVAAVLAMAAMPLASPTFKNMLPVALCWPTCQAPSATSGKAHVPRPSHCGSLPPSCITPCRYVLEDEYNRTVGAAPPHLKKAEETGHVFP